MVLCGNTRRRHVVKSRFKPCCTIGRRGAESEPYFLPRDRKAERMVAGLTTPIVVRDVP